MDISIMSRQIFMLAIAMFIGFISIKTKYLTVETREFVSKIIVKITLPLLCYTALTNRNFTLETAKDAGFVLLLAIVIIFSLHFIGILSSKVFRIKGATGIVHSCLMCFGNVGFIGFPIITAVYGQEGLFYAVIFTAVNDVLIWTLGVVKMAKSGTSQKGVNFKALINPSTIAYFLSIVSILVGFRLPSVVQETFTAVGDLTIYLSMLFIGMTLAIIDLKGIFKHFSLILIILLKMFILPVAIAIILSYFKVDKLITSVVALQVSMPCATIMSIISSEYKSDYKYAATGVFVTTILSLFSLPLVYMFINYIV